MGDRGYTIGILIGCVLLLSAGIVFTWFEIDEYRLGVRTPDETLIYPDRSVPEPDPQPEPILDTEQEPENATEQAE